MSNPNEHIEAGFEPPNCTPPESPSLQSVAEGAAAKPPWQQCGHPCEDYMRDGPGCGCRCVEVTHAAGAVETPGVMDAPWYYEEAVQRSGQLSLRYVVKSHSGQAQFYVSSRLEAASIVAMAAKLALSDFAPLLAERDERIKMLEAELDLWTDGKTLAGVGATVASLRTRIAELENRLNDENELAARLRRELDDAKNSEGSWRASWTEMGQQVDAIRAHAAELEQDKARLNAIFPTNGLIPIWTQTTGHVIAKKLHRRRTKELTGSDVAHAIVSGYRAARKEGEAHP